MAGLVDSFLSVVRFGIFKSLRRRVEYLLGDDSGVGSSTKISEPTLEQKKKFENYKEAFSIIKNAGHLMDSKIQATYLCKVFLLDQRRDFLVSVEHDFMDPIIKSNMKIEAVSTYRRDESEKIEL